MEQEACSQLSTSVSVGISKQSFRLRAEWLHHRVEFPLARGGFRPLGSWRWFGEAANIHFLRNKWQFHLQHSANTVQYTVLYDVLDDMYRAVVQYNCTDNSCTSVKTKLGYFFHPCHLPLHCGRKRSGPTKRTTAAARPSRFSSVDFSPNRQYCTQ